MLSLAEGAPKSLPGRPWRLLTSPQAEWQRIAEESAGQWCRLVGYAFVLASIGPIIISFHALLYGWETAFDPRGLPLAVDSLSDLHSPASPLGSRHREITPLTALFWILMATVSSIVAVILSAFVLHALMRLLGRKGSLWRAVQVAAYSATPVWLASGLVLSILLIAVLVLALFHSGYLFYSGVRKIYSCASSEAQMVTGLTVLSMFIVLPLMGYLMSVAGLGPVMY